MAVVLDASALLAYWLDEPGAEVVTMAVSAEGAFVAAPNFAEALTKLVDRSPDLAQKLPSVPPTLAGEAASTLPGVPLAGGAISSLTADQHWSKLSLGISIEVIR